MFTEKKDFASLTSAERSKLRHDLKGSLESLRGMHALIQSGYRFNDEDAESIIERVETAIDQLDVYMNYSIKLNLN